MRRRKRKREKGRRVLRISSSRGPGPRGLRGRVVGERPLGTSGSNQSPRGVVGVRTGSPGAITAPLHKPGEDVRECLRPGERVQGEGEEERGLAMLAVNTVTGHETAGTGGQVGSETAGDFQGDFHNVSSNLEIIFAPD